jgi:hypothetical protein
VRVVRFDLDDGKLNRKQFAVFALCRHRSYAADGTSFSGFLIAFDILVVLGSVGFGHEIIHLAAGDFFDAVAKNPFGCGIAQYDAASSVDRNARILGGFY